MENLKHGVEDFIDENKQQYEQMKSIVYNHDVATHQFLETFRRGKLTQEQFKLWLSEQFHFSISLPSAFGAIYARLPNRFWKEKRPLVELMNVEAWGSEEEGAHSGYFKELCEFVSLDIDELTQQYPKEYTREYLDLRLDMCLNPQWSVGVGLTCIGVGNEELNRILFQAYYEGINHIPGLEHCPTGYLKAHVDDEEADSLIFAKLYGLVVKTDAERQQAERGLIQLLDGRNLFFDNLSQDLNIP